MPVDPITSLTNRIHDVIADKTDKLSPTDAISAATDALVRYILETSPDGKVARSRVEEIHGRMRTAVAMTT